MGNITSLQHGTWSSSGCWPRGLESTGLPQTCGKRIERDPSGRQTLLGTIYLQHHVTICSLPGISSRCALVICVAHMLRGHLGFHTAQQYTWDSMENDSAVDGDSCLEPDIFG